MQLLLGSDFYEVVEAMMTKAVKKRVKAKAKVKKCIRKDCTNPQAPGCRELCTHHSNQFEYGRKLAKKRGVTVLKKYERDEVAAGRVAPSRRGQRSTNDYKQRAQGS